MSTLPVAAVGSLWRRSTETTSFEVEVPRYRADFWLAGLREMACKLSLELAVDDQPRADWTKRVLTVAVRGGFADIDSLERWLAYAHRNYQFGIRTLVAPRRSV